MKSEFTNRLLNFTSRNFNKVYSKLCSFFVKHVVCRSRYIKIGDKNVFIGLTSFYKGNGGEIVIGNNNKFISCSTANKIGLNHKCIISATPGVSETCKIEIGNNCGFSGTSIWCFEHIKIGNNVRCGANTLIMDGDAHFDDERTSPPKPIFIEDNVFLGAGVTVRKGVTIGKNSVIGMNSMVTHDIPENVIAVGTPCKVIKRIKL